MEHITKRVVMAKKVASQYIANISKPHHTLTVYFTNDSDMNSFLRNVKASDQCKNITICEHFDRVTFVSTDSAPIQHITASADDCGFDFSDM